jgi:hypothetical protein
MSESFKTTLIVEVIIGLLTFMCLTMVYDFTLYRDKVNTIEFHMRENVYKDYKIILLKEQILNMKIKMMDYNLTNSHLYLQWKSNQK